MFLNSTIQTKGDWISIDGYNLIRADHPSDWQKVELRGGVCIYYKEHIPLIKRDYICTLDNFLVTEICSKFEKIFNLFLSFPTSELLRVWWFLYKIWFFSKQHKS